MKREFKFTYDHFSSFEELNEKQKKAVRAADEAVKTAYAPYSKFNVGAALLLKDGSIILGSNQENKAFPSGLCAERVALFSYGAQINKSEIEILAVVGSGAMLQTHENFTPCGSCRQVMSEYSSLQENPFEIILRNGDNSYTVFSSVQQLLPFIFGDKE